MAGLSTIPSNVPGSWYATAGDGMKTAKNSTAAAEPVHRDALRDVKRDVDTVLPFLACASDTSTLHRGAVPNIGSGT